jgi:predicted RNA-binding Zn-ribbon protein involved in translation (DUF1610 family)
MSSRVAKIEVKRLVVCPSCNREIIICSENDGDVEEYVSDFTCPYCKNLIRAPNYS